MDGTLRMARLQDGESTCMAPRLVKLSGSSCMSRSWVWLPGTLSPCSALAYSPQVETSSSRGQLRLMTVLGQKADAVSL